MSQAPVRKRSAKPIILLVIVAIVLISAVISAVSDDSTGSGGSTESSEWGEWPSGLRPSIDAYAADRDCVGLQATFDSVDQADGSHPDILNYINDKMESAGCYS